MPVKGADVVAKNIVAFGGGFLKHVNTTMKKVSVVLDKKVTENMSLIDHTTADLRRLDHPYAKRHGSAGLGIHSPYWQVHKQSGRLLASKRADTVVAESNGTLLAKAFVSLDPFEVPYANAVIYGTSTMIPRPVLQESRDQILDEAQGIIKTNLKNLTITFQGERTT